MRIPAAGFEMQSARTLDDALRMLASGSGWRPFAGGTDLMVLMEAQKLPPGRYLSLWGLDELHGISVDAGAVTLGALTTYSDVLRHAVVSREFGLLAEAARQTGGVATQNRGTIGGNIANGSPAADTPPALLVYDAEIELVSVRGRRRVPYPAFHTGYKKMDLAADEIVSSVVLPRRRERWVEEYRKVGTRRAQAISKVCFAAAVRPADGAIAAARVAFGSVAPTVVRCPHVEEAIVGRPLTSQTIDEASQALLRDISPIDDVRSTAAYRRRVAQNLLTDFLRRVAA